MIVLDTNVLSEPLRVAPDPHVTRWLTTSDASVAITAVSVGELLTGARRLPHGRRREGLLEAIESIIDSFSGSILPFDAAAARRYATMQEARRSAGHPLSTEDGMIAAICASHDAVLATRNTKDFDHLGVPLVDPWSSTP
ncbi:MAG TPA: type II toxin-antitoxin system VapC family toxin [Cellulomonas sp.]